MTARGFPVQDSTLSAEALAAWAAEEYQLPRGLSCAFHRKGICDTYRVTAGGAEYYLKVSRHGRRSELDVSEEVRLLKHLSDRGVLVAEPIARKDARYVSRLTAPEGTRYAVLYGAATGVPGDDDEPDRIRAFGEMVGRMHACADEMPGAYRRKHLDMKHLIDENLSLITPFASHRPADLCVVQRLAEQCRRRIEELPRTKPQYGICHGDLHGGDVRYMEGKIPVLFDFDSSGCGWRALDIGVYLASDAWMDTSDEAENRRQRRLATFLEGYSTHRPLTDAELSVVQLGPPVRHIFLMGHVLRHTATHQGDHWADDGFIDWHMAWFKHWAEI